MKSDAEDTFQLCSLRHAYRLEGRETKWFNLIKKNVEILVIRTYLLNRYITMTCISKNMR